MPGMKPLLAASALLMAACASPPRQAAIPAEMGKRPAAFGKEPVVVLADSSEWTVVPGLGGEGNRLERRSVSWFRINRRHPPQLQSLAFHDDGTTELIPKVKVDVFYPDGEAWSAKDEDMPREPARILGVLASNSHRRYLRLPRYTEGMLIRREVRQVMTRPEFRSREFLRGEHPCVRRVLRFRLPADWEARAGFRNGEGLVAQYSEKVEGGMRVFTVEARDLPRLQPFHRMPYPEEWYAAFHFSVPAAGKAPPDWKGLGDAYLALLAGSLGPSPAVEALAKVLRTEDPDSLALEAFALLTSRIRYLADEADLNAFIPRHPDTVLRNGYGDCKEMANLMRALLAEKGVATGLALVHSPGRPQMHPDFPSLSAFNHVILYRRAEDGTVRYYDPTLASADPGSSWLHLTGQKVLLLATGASVVDTVEAAPGYRNRAATRSELVATAKSGGTGGNGTGGEATGKGWTLRGTVGLKGKAAFEMNMALRYLHPGKDEARTAVWDFLAQGFAIHASEWDWKAPSADSLEITYSMPAEQMAVGLGKGGVKLDVPSLLGMGAQGVDYEGDRHYAPFEQEDTWVLPRNYRPLKTREFRSGTAEGRWSSAAASGTVSRRFRHGGMVWKSDAKEDLVRFLGRVSEFAVAAVWR